MGTTLLAVDWSHVWLVTGVGFVMVFILLVMLTFIMRLLGKVIDGINNRQKVTKPKKEIVIVEPVKQDQPDEKDMAAIAMALHLYYNSVHDIEPTKITIKRVQGQSSAWNNKMYGMNNLHR